MGQWLRRTVKTELLKGQAQRYLTPCVLVLCNCQHACSCCGVLALLWSEVDICQMINNANRPCSRHTAQRHSSFEEQHLTHRRKGRHFAQPQADLEVVGGGTFRSHSSNNGGVLFEVI